MRISDWSSDVCSSDLAPPATNGRNRNTVPVYRVGWPSKMNPIPGPQHNWSYVIPSHLDTAPRERHIDRVIVKTNIECGPGHPNPCVGGGDGERMPLVMCDIEPGAPCEQTPATSAISVVYGNCTAGIDRKSTRL